MPMESSRCEDRRSTILLMTLIEEGGASQNQLRIGHNITDVTSQRAMVMKMRTHRKAMMNDDVSNDIVGNLVISY